MEEKVNSRSELNRTYKFLAECTFDEHMGIRVLQELHRQAGEQLRLLIREGNKD